MGVEPLGRRVVESYDLKCPEYPGTHRTFVIEKTTTYETCTCYECNTEIYDIKIDPITLLPCTDFKGAKLGMEIKLEYNTKCPESSSHRFFKYERSDISESCTCYECDTEIYDIKTERPSSRYTRKESTPLPTNKPDGKCPFCHSSRVEKISVLSAGLLSLFGSAGNKKFRCLKCNQRF